MEISKLEDFASSGMWHGRSRTGVESHWIDGFRTWRVEEDLVL